MHDLRLAERIKTELAALERYALSRYGRLGYSMALHSSKASDAWDREPCIYLTTAAGSSMPMTWALLSECYHIGYVAGMRELQCMLVTHPEEAGKRDGPLTRVTIECVAVPQRSLARFELQISLTPDAMSPVVVWIPNRPDAWPA